MGSVTARLPNWGALTAGGAVGHDKAVIPKREAFFDLDRGLKPSQTGWVRGIEFAYGQHWYWYQAARILTLGVSTIVYLPRDRTFSVTATGARSAFSGTWCGMAFFPVLVGSLSARAQWSDKLVQRKFSFTLRAPRILRKSISSEASLHNHMAAGCDFSSQHAPGRQRATAGLPKANARTERTPNFGFAMESIFSTLWRLGLVKPL